MTPPRRTTSRPPPPPGEFVVSITTPGLLPEIIERLCGSEQEGWGVFYEHCCRTQADVRLFRNGAVVARRFAIRESIPS